MDHLTEVVLIPDAVLTPRAQPRTQLEKLALRVLAVWSECDDLEEAIRDLKEEAEARKLL